MINKINDRSNSNTIDVRDMGFKYNGDPYTEE